MKKLLSSIAFVMILALSLTCFAGCELPFELPFDLPFGGQPTEPADENTVTVSWYYGSKLLKEDKVEKGTKVVSWDPVVEGKTFTGWFAEASLAEPFDFEKAIEADTDIFAAFKSDEHVADENSYYLIGAGAGDMGQAAWDHAKAEANLTMTKQDVAGANVYKIQIKMYAGDMFQICYGGSWDGQVGIGLVEGAEYCDGVNFVDNKSYTAADKKVAQVKDAEGNVVFIGSDEYNKSFEVWNIKLAEGMDGIYEFTYTTYPNAGAYNTISYKLVEKIEPMSVTHDMCVIGTHNNWSESFEEDSPYRLTVSTDKATWTGTFVVTEEMYADWTATDPSNPLGVKCAAVKIYNTIGGGYYSPDGNNIFLTAGTYSIKFTVEGNKVEIAKCDYYFVGTFVDADGKAVNFCVKEGATPSLTVADGVATGTFTATDVTAMGDFSWIADQGKPGVFAFKIVYGSELGIAEWYSDDANGGDNWYVNAGTYEVSFNLETKAVTITAK